MEENQRRYRDFLLVILPLVGILISVEALNGTGWGSSPVGLLLLVFFVVMLAIRVVIWARGIWRAR